jgi:WD40 repeat protein
MIWYEVHVDPLCSLPVTIKLHNPILLPKDCVVKSLSFDFKSKLLLMGTKVGAIVAFDLKSEPLSKPKDEENIPSHEAIMVFRRVHGPNAVSALTVEECDGSSVLFYSGGLDGNYGEFLLSKNSDVVMRDDKNLEYIAPGWTISKTQFTRITRGRIEKIFKVDGQTLVIGNFDENLFVFNIYSNLYLLHIKMGVPSGRVWDFKTSSATLEEFVCCYIGDGKAFYTSRESTNNMIKNPILKESYHCLETRSVAYLDFLGIREQVLVSGGEDEALTFHTFENKKGLKNIGSHRLHLASIKCIDFNRHGNILFSGGAEQKLFAWKLSPTLSEEGKLEKLSCAQIGSAPSWNDLVETRIMDLSILSVNPNCLLVATANSDSLVHLWKFDEQAGFTLLDQSKVHKPMRTKI